MFLESVSMGTSENVSEMSLAAIKAWETRRKNAASSSSSKNEKTGKEKKEVKKTIGRTVKEILKQERVKDVSNVDAGLKADESREMKALNGTELEQLAKQTQKKLDRKQAFDDAKNGKRETKAVEVGKVIKKAKIERFNGGVRLGA